MNSTTNSNNCPLVVVNIELAYDQRNAEKEVIRGKEKNYNYESN